MRAFFRRNLYWLLIVALLLGVVIYEYPQARPGRAVAELLSDEDALLKRRVHVDFDGVPMAEALAALGREAQCTVTLDHSWGPAGFAKITVHASGAVPLEQAITMVMRVADTSTEGMAAWQENGLVRVGPSRLISQGPRVTAVYNMAAIMGNLDEKAQENKMANLVNLIHESFFLYRSGGGDVGGDNGSVASFDDKLIVRTTPFTQREIADFLANLQSW